MNNTFIDMEVNKGVKRYQIIKCKLEEKDINKVEEINKFFQDFKKEYRKADTKKAFYKLNDINTDDSIIYNLKLILDLFNWEEITVEKINKVSKEQKKKAENLLKTLQRRIKQYEDNRKL